MKKAGLMLLRDFLSTIVFLALFALTDNVVLSTGLAIAAALVEFGYELARGHKIVRMQAMSLALVVVFGGASLMTGDPRIIMLKPSIIHLAIAAVMLKRGWLMDYLPERAKGTLPPSLVTASGYGWAALMAALALGNLIVALAFGWQVWAPYTAVVPLSAKALAFLVQYAVFRGAYRRQSKTIRAPNELALG